MISPAGRFSLIILICILTGQVIEAGKSAEEVGSSSSSALSSQLTKAEKNVDDEQQIVSPTVVEKVPSEHLEYFADYLVMAKDVKTEIVAQQNQANGQWRMKRAIVRSPDVEALTVYEQDMAAVVGVNNAIRCFLLVSRDESSSLITNEQEKHPAEFLVKGWKHFHRLNCGNNFIKIWKLFDRSTNGRLQVSNRVNKKLESQSECLANFLAENFGTEHLHIEKIKETNGIDLAILKANKVRTRHWKDEVVRWKWAAVEAEQSQQTTMMPEIHYNEGTLEYTALLKCFEILPVKDGIHRDESFGKSFVELNPLLARFRGDQLFVREMLNKDKTFTIDNASMPKGNDECIICLGNFTIGDEVQQFPCSHIFHKKCIGKWQKETCPICRRGIKKRAKPDNLPYESTLHFLNSSDDSASDDEQHHMMRTHIRQPPIVPQFGAQLSERTIVRGPLRWTGNTANIVREHGESSTTLVNHRRFDAERRVDAEQRANHRQIGADNRIGAQNRVNAEQHDFYPSDSVNLQLENDYHALQMLQYPFP